MSKEEPINALSDTAAPSSISSVTAKSTDKLIVNPRTVHLISSRELMQMPDPKYLVDGLLQNGGFAMLYAEAGVGKTFLAMSWSVAIAEGLTWLGRAVNQGPVVYFAAEGIGGFRKRLRALMEHHVLDEPPSDLYFVKETVSLFETATVEKAGRVIEAMAIKPALIVFDTYARSMVGADENSAKDAGRVIAAIERMMQGFGCAVLVVHHTGKTGRDDRGSGALTGAVDTKLYLGKSTVQGDRTLTIEKQKNFEAAGPVTFSLDSCADSLVVKEPSAAAQWQLAAGAPNTRDALTDAIVAALKVAVENGQTPIRQETLLASVRGNRQRKLHALHDLAEDQTSPVVVVKRNRSNLYDLSSDSDGDSGSVPPTP